MTEKGGCFQSSNRGDFPGQREIWAEVGKERAGVSGIQRKTGLEKQRQGHIYMGVFLHFLS